MAKRERAYRPGQTLNLSVSVETRTALRKYSEATGRSQQFVASKLVAWFMAQPSGVQRVVMGDVEGMEAEYAAALRALADQLERKAKA